VNGTVSVVARESEPGTVRAGPGSGAEDHPGVVLLKMRRVVCFA